VEVRLLLARALVAAGDAEEAAESLRDALNTGVLDRATLSSAGGLDSLARDPEYADLFAPAAR
jgi:hypothetical protein